jgi:hypothetical protein
MTPAIPDPAFLAQRSLKLRPKSMSFQEWLILITAILSAILQVTGGGTATSMGPGIAAATSKYKPASMTGAQWLQLIIAILVEILDTVQGSGS